MPQIAVALFVSVVGHAGLLVALGHFHGGGAYETVSEPLVIYLQGESAAEATPEIAEHESVEEMIQGEVAAQSTPREIPEAPRVRVDELIQPLTQAMQALETQIKAAEQWTGRTLHDVRHRADQVRPSLRGSRPDDDHRLATTLAPDGDARAGEQPLADDEPPHVPTDASASRAAASAPGHAAPPVVAATAGIGVNRGATVERLSVPVYPKRAVRLGLEGAAVIAIDVDPAGSAAHVQVRVSSGHSLLDAAALDAARKGRFRPAVRNGEAIHSTIVVPFVFRLEEQR